jgi:hypothetical protein
MNLPEPIDDFLELLRQPWKPVSAPAVFIGAFLYAWFLLYAFSRTGAMFMIDNVNLPIHEGGHLVFGVFGWEELTVWGGTLMQCLVPFALALGFAYRREISGTAFCAFMLFENFLNVATYMADAREQDLPLVTTGQADYIEHDWAHILGHLNLLQYDTTFATGLRAVAYLGMLATISWMLWKWWQQWQQTASAKAAGL